MGKQGSEGGRSGQLKRRRLSVATVDQAADGEEDALEQQEGAAGRAASAGEAWPPVAGHRHDSGCGRVSLGKACCAAPAHRV